MIFGKYGLPYYNRYTIIGFSILYIIIYSKIIELYLRLYNQSIYKIVLKQDPILISPIKLISSYYNPISV
jgi:hypothetical protein